MHKPLKKFATTIIGCALMIGQVQAQTGGNLPLVSIGSQTNWIQDAETYRIRVPQGYDGQPLGLQVYSPAMNLNDYANNRATSTYYGDELYSRKEPFETRFVLKNERGETLFERVYGTAQDHTWEELWSSGLPKGTYTLTVTSKGYGKNAFALRVAAPFTLEGHTFSLNARGSGDLLAARFGIDASYLGHEIEISNYDADGAEELALDAITPDGQIKPLVPSENGKTFRSTFPITQNLLGEWRLVVRVLKTTRQYSNAFAFQLGRPDAPIWAGLPAFVPSAQSKLKPLTVTFLDSLGNGVPEASYRLSSKGLDCVVEAQVPRNWIATQVNSDGKPLSKTEVLLPNCEGNTVFVMQPNLGSLKVNAVAWVGGTRIPLSDTAIQVNGQSLKTPTEIQLEPGDYPIVPLPISGATAETPIGHVVFDQQNAVTVEYRVQPTLHLELQPSEIDACDTTVAVLTAKTDFPYALPIELGLGLPSGMTSTEPLKQSTSFSKSQDAVWNVPVRACENGILSGQLLPFGLNDSAALTVRPPQGTLSIRAVAILGDQKILLDQTAVSLDGKMVTVPTTLTLKPGLYTVVPSAIPGSTAQPIVAQVSRNGSTQVTVAYQVSGQLKLQLEPNDVGFCGPVHVSAVASTEFPYPMPVSLGLSLPKGIQTRDLLEAPGIVKKGTVHTLDVQGIACDGGEIKGWVAPLGLAASAELGVRPPQGTTVVQTEKNGTYTLKRSLVKTPTGYTVSLDLDIDRSLWVKILDPLGDPKSISRSEVQRLDASGKAWPVDIETNATLVLGNLPAGHHRIVYDLITQQPADKLSTPEIFWNTPLP
ncbi:MAG: hypothetical protein U0Z75_03975 [Deinococcaceae bacterium]